MSESATSRIVVGYDGSEHARPALAWAAAEAADLGVELALLAAQDLSGAAGAEMGWSLGLEQMAREGAARILAEASDELRATHPGLHVTAKVVLGSPASALIDASEEAALVVVGTRGAGGFRGLLLGSVAGAVTSHASCPVVVVPHAASTDEAARPAGRATRGPVVVGVDGSAESQGAAEFAFAQAAARSVGVVAVHSWTVAFHGGVVPTDEGSDAFRAMRAEQRALVERSVEDARAAYPDVPVEERIERGTSVEVLTDAGAGATMLVVGSRGRGGFRGMLLGSTTREVLEKATCPVAVVRR